jgi:hypothetical protein
MQYTIEELNMESIKRLYCDFGFTAKAIGGIFGVSEDAIFKRMKTYGITSDSRGAYNSKITVVYEGIRKDLKNKLTDDILRTLHAEGKTDSNIGKLFKMSGEGVAYRRKKLNLGISIKVNDIQKERVIQTPKEVLEKDYYELTQEEFSSKYGVSKTTWRPIIQDKGILLKTQKQSPPLTHNQIVLIIGGLLGDGGIDSSPRYYESHSLKQEQYLRLKHKLLEPYSTNCYPCDNGTGLRFATIQSEHFSKFRESFYKEGVEGKLIPIDLISEYWDERILAYWFIDDGYYDDDSRFLIINNYCPIKEQLSAFVDFLENKLGWGFQLYKSGISFSKKFYKEFFDIVYQVATPDVLYKIPEEFLIPDKVNTLTPLMVHPKFYRVGNDVMKARMFNMTFEQYWGKPFPFSDISDSRALYLLRSFKDNGISTCDGDLLSFNTSGMELCEKFFPNIYSSKRKGYPAPIDVWVDETFFKKLVENRLRYADRINDSSMRKGLKLMNTVVSNFKPSIARYIYANFCKNGKVLDYSAGFGSRMLAAMSLGMEYVGFEPNTITYENLLNFGAFVKANLGGNYCVHNKGSEVDIPYTNYFGLAFSSPPYFDYESYSNEESQSINRFPELSDWLTQYWDATVKGCIKSLREDGVFGVCYSPNQKVPLIERSINTCSNLGYKLFKVLRIPFKHVTTSDSYEVILLFSRHVKDSINWVNLKNSYDNIIKCTDAPHEVNKRAFSVSFDENTIQNKFKEVSLKLGMSRETYREKSILGAPSHVIEHYYGSWNKFIEACGMIPQYQAETPTIIVSEYFKECLAQNKALSFYEYGKIRGNNYTLKMKRLFNAGKKYASLKEELFKVAPIAADHGRFLKEFM